MSNSNLEPNQHNENGTCTRSRILMIAPQPFFSARGTPFSVLHRIRALTEKGYSVDLVTYPFGEDVKLNKLRIFRSSSLPFIKKIKIGPSIPKLLLDIPLYFKTRQMLRRNNYDILHSHEEAAFFCTGLAKKYSLIHIYDMHSSLPQQLSNFKSFNIGILHSIFEHLENHVLKTCDGVITICTDLAKIVHEKCPEKPHKMIENIGEDSKVFKASSEDIIGELSLENKKVLLYTGTFEAYQGIDLLLESIVHLSKDIKDTVLVLVGGTSEQIQYYKTMSQKLGIEDMTRYTGTIHPSRIPGFLKIADVIVSPRSRGTNTPLKIYGYLRTNTPLVATDRYTHTQILNKDIAELVPADSKSIAKGIYRLLTDDVYANKIASNAKQFANDNFSDEKYIDMVAELYNNVLSQQK